MRHVTYLGKRVAAALPTSHRHRENYVAASVVI